MRFVQSLNFEGVDLSKPEDELGKIIQAVCAQFPRERRAQILLFVRDVSNRALEGIENEQKKIDAEATAEKTNGRSGQ